MTKRFRKVKFASAAQAERAERTSKHTRHGLPWSEDDLKKLKAFLDSGVPIENIEENLGRTCYAIVLKGEAKGWLQKNPISGSYWRIVRLPSVPDEDLAEFDPKAYEYAKRITTNAVGMQCCEVDAPLMRVFTDNDGVKHYQPAHVPAIEAMSVINAACAAQPVKEETKMSLSKNQYEGVTIENRVYVDGVNVEALTFDQLIDKMATQKAMIAHLEGLTQDLKSVAVQQRIEALQENLQALAAVVDGLFATKTLEAQPAGEQGGKIDCSVNGEQV